MLKDLRFLLLVFLVAVSVYYIISPNVFGKSGVFVTDISTGVECTNVDIGSLITQVELYKIDNIDDFNLAIATVKGGQFVSLIADGKPANCIAVSDDSLGLSASNAKRSGITFGIDIEGGSRILLKPKEPIGKDLLSETISTLNTRVDLYGLRDIKVSPLGEDVIQVEMGGVTGSEITDFLSKQGKFEAKIEQTVKFSNGQGSLIFKGESVVVEYYNGSVNVGGKIYHKDETLLLDNVELKILNVTNTSAVFLASAFTGDDILAVYTDSENSYITRTGDIYEYGFTIQVSDGGAERFAKLTKNLPIRFLGNQRYLEPELILFLDREPVARLNIAASLAGEKLTRPLIQGAESSRDAALDERLKMQSILKSGSLPVELDIIKTDIITQTAGKTFLDSIIFVALSAALVVSGIILLRYKDPKIAAPMILISFSEILIVLGFAAFTQVVTNGSGWILDIPAIAGLIAIIGTGVNQFIIITDKLLNEPDVSLKFRNKMAMEMVFNSAYIVIAAMTPLVVIGVGALRGFAITTILGVVIAIFVTRPAYMSILERVKKLN